MTELIIISKFSLLILENIAGKAIRSTAINKNAVVKDRFLEEWSSALIQ